MITRMRDWKQWMLAMALCASPLRAEHDEIGRWIARLGDDALAARQEAYDRLLGLGNDRPEAVLARLAPLLGAEDPETREQARSLEREISWISHKRTALAEVGGDPDKIGLVERLFDRERECAGELGRIVPLLGRERAVLVLGAFLDHPRSSVRRTALMLLSDLKAVAFGARAMEMIRDPDINVRLSAIDAVGKLRFRPALADLGGLLEQMPEDWMKAMRGNMYFAHQIGLARAIRAIAGPSWDDADLTKAVRVLPAGGPWGDDEEIRKARVWLRRYQDGKIPESLLDAPQPEPASPAPGPDDEGGDDDDMFGG